MINTYDFSGKVAFVSGAASGIGLTAAQGFAKAGASVVLVDLNLSAVELAAEELKSAGYNVRALACDVSNEEQVTAAVASTIHSFGRLDMAYNNAGLHAPSVETADALLSDFEKVVSVNMTGVWLCMKHQLVQMRKQGYGAIVNCSSQAGTVGIAGLGAYTASKHGVIGLSKAAALEYANKGIRINVLCPGTSDTPMVAKAVLDHPNEMRAVINDIPMQRMGYAQEIADSVLWLCSPGAGFMTGQILAVDGGYTTK